MKTPQTDAAIDPVRAPRPRAYPAPGERRFGRFNRLGAYTLIEREVIRFLKVYGQTIAAPVATAAMFLAVFTLAIGSRRADIEGLPFAAFLAPGLVMMTVIQNAFANTSSSVMIQKVQGNIVDTLMPPLSSGELVLGWAMGGVARGLVVALIGGLVLFPFVGVGLAAPHWALFFALAGSLMLGLLGLIAGIWAVKFDHMAAVTNFVVTPLSFLSGTFYTVADLPEPWRTLSHWNPIFYLIDGFRYGTTGVSDSSPWIGAGVIVVICAALWAAAWRMLESGYRLKS
ncbi:MAG: ABC transporter permease [Pseudomonadota bacterium]